MSKAYFIRHFFTGVVLIALISGCAENYNQDATGEYLYDSGVNDPDIPPVIFNEPPELIVIPDTYIYVAPDVDMDIFFYNGWWWRPWGGRWYRSQHYRSGWKHYRDVPHFYRDIPRNWRHDYRTHRWQGHQWNYKRIPHHNVQRNWREWENSRYWEKQHNWGVHDLKHRKRSEELKRDRNNRRERVYPQQDQNNRRERVYPQQDRNNRHERVYPQQDRNNRRERVYPQQDQNNRRERVNPQQDRNQLPSRVVPQQEQRRQQPEEVIQERSDRLRREAEPAEQRQQDNSDQRQRHNRGGTFYNLDKP